jgi:thioredoxin reductase (NADPH)
MAKTHILTVDDEPQVLGAVNRDLRKHYRGEYRILRANSGAEALKTVIELKERNAALALFLVDQRMPGMTGTEFLTQAQEIFPDARKVLLTAYADTEAAIDSINTIGLDHYLMKPWDPPEQNLFPVLDDLLSDWEATVPRPYDGIRVAGTLWSARSHDVKDFLSRNRIPYQWLDLEKDSEAQRMVDETGQGKPRLPVVYFPDGAVLQDPTARELAEQVGLKTQAEQAFYDLIIVGGGPAGLGAAVYGASEGLRTLMIEQAATGGQAGTSSRIENYLGFPKGLSGADLARRATAQAQRFGAEILTARQVSKIRVEDPYRITELSDGTEISGHAILVATGVTIKQLNAPGVDALTGAGVYYGAAMTEAANYRDQDVFIVGGANSAGQGAMFFSRYAKSVTMLVRSTSLAKGMSQYLVDQIESTANITVQLRSVVEGVNGSQKLESIDVKNIDSGETVAEPAAALFIFIGAVAHSNVVDGLVNRNRAGFILTGPDLIQDGERPQGWRQPRDPFMLETSVPGIFAAGDVRSGSAKRVASAVGEGSVAVQLIHQYLKYV